MNTKNADQVADGALTAPVASPQSLGQQLRAAREARGISLREVSEGTRISMRYLEAIESDNYKHLPGGIFNRSFVKAYARHIGFNEAAAMDAFTRTANEQGDKSEELTPYRPRVYANNNEGRPKWVTALLTILILAILSLGVYAALHWYQRKKEARLEAQGAATNNEVARQQSNPNAQPSPVSASNAFSVRVRAKNQRVWIQTQVDDRSAEAVELKPDETKEFTPQERLRLQYARVMASNLEIMINNRLAKVPTESRNKSAEMIITKDYEQLLQ